MLIVAGILATFLVAAPACLLDAPLPELGPCAELPDAAAYEYGQLGIGTCLASPSDLRVRPDPQNPENHFLFVVNSNSRGNFTGSSLLSIDASSIDLTCPANGLHEVQADALRMQEFAGRIDFEEGTGLALVTNRNTGGYQGQLDDVVFTVDASDPRRLAFSDAGPRSWGPYRFIRVPADPWSVRVNPWNGRAYVLGLTTHEVSALDLTSDPISFIDLRGESQTGDPVFEDVDESGSAPDFEVFGWRPSFMEDETFSIRWMAGTTRLYYPVSEDDGSVSVVSADSGDGVAFTQTPGGAVIAPGVDWAASRLGAVSVQRQEDQLIALVAGRSQDGLEQIGHAFANEDALDWTLAGSPSLEAVVGAWDESGVRDPDFVRADDDYRVYFAGGEGLGRALAHARGSSLTSLSREGDESLDGGDLGVVLRPDPAGFDQVAVFAPSILRDGNTGEYLLWYSGHSDLSELLGSTEVPAGLAVGLARSDDGVHFVRTDQGEGGSAVVLGPGEPGEWDSAGVAAMSVFFADG
ncbi:MAG: hypothetical protein CL928_17355, partial [Deltaproteobacteria bacterium]|nr:hypothetical protein [Deltaproteobacteria bacterium]